tara:strand:- start:562 stop:1452 length:891 start_codon:yes stop_codon:yes gene_type:complete
MITIGSLFSGIGGFELGLERAIPNSKTIWQVEQDSFCQKILKKHWPNAKLYNDVKEVGAHNLEAPDIICGGFPCQGISQAGKMEGLKDERSGLWWEMHRIISELRPKVVVVENVPALLVRGMSEVLGSMAKIGYDAEWSIISAGGSKGFGAPHLRKRVFIVFYPSKKSNKRWTTTNTNSNRIRTENAVQTGREVVTVHVKKGNAAYPNSTSCKKQSMHSFCLEATQRSKHTISKSQRIQSENYWKKNKIRSPFCNMDDGIPNRVDRIKALGNAIVPQCSEWVGKQILNSGLLNDLS